MAELSLRVAMSFAATIGASILFNVPKRELFFCGLTAAAGWLIYELTVRFLPVSDTAIATLFAAIALSVCARLLSYRRKTPVTIYLVAGIFPIVPGAGIYYTMYEMVVNDAVLESIENGIATAKAAGAIAVGILTVLSLPQKFFIGKGRERKNV